MSDGSASMGPGVSPATPTLTMRTRRAVRDLFQSKSAAVGAFIILAWVFVGLAAPLISPYSPTEIQGGRLESPSLAHWLGTDHLGRDVLSRLFWGTQVVLYLAPTSVFLGILLGAPLGLISGYVGGRTDAVIMRGVDILLSFPTLLIYILIITSIGSSAIIVVIAIALGSIPPITRIMRSLVLDERTKDYVNAARLRGERRHYVLVREILPNVSGPIIVVQLHPGRLRDYGDRLAGLSRPGHSAAHTRLGRNDQRGAGVDLHHALDSGCAGSGLEFGRDRAQSPG